MQTAVAEKVSKKTVLPVAQFPDPGIYYDVPEHVYHADKTAISNSLLTEFRRSPRHFLYIRDNGSTETTFDVFGRALHSYVLEPNQFENKYAVKKKVDGRTKDGKAYNESFALQNEGKGIIDEAEFERIKNMADSLFSNDYFSKITKTGRPEITIVWVDPDTGVKCRGRLDWVRDDGIIFDLKGIDGASPSEMKRKAFNFNYQWQSTFYGDGLTEVIKMLGLKMKPVESYVMGTIEKEAPHECAFYTFDDNTINDTRIRYKKLLADYKKCLETDIWPGYPQELIVLESPRWLAYD